MFGCVKGDQLGRSRGFRKKNFNVDGWWEGRDFEC